MNAETEDFYEEETTLAIIFYCHEIKFYYCLNNLYKYSFTAIFSHVCKRDHKVMIDHSIQRLS